MTLHLDDPGVGEELLAFAERSANPNLKEMASELEPMLKEEPIVPESIEEQEDDEEVVYYRGAPVHKEKAPVPDDESTKPTTRIYRGQKIG